MVQNGNYFTNNIIGEVKKEDFVKGTPFIHPTMLIRKKDIEKIGGYPLYLRLEDYAMEMEMYANGFKGYIMPDILINYRMNEDGYKKKKYKYRVSESKVKWIYFRKLNIEFYKYIYCLKPILIGIIPNCIIKKLKNLKKEKCNKNE